MTTTALHSSRRSQPSTPVHPTVRARRLTAGVLTALATVFFLGFVVAFGAFGAFVLLVTLPLPLLFLWASSDVLRSDELKP
jgi:fatty acid desaturase